MNPISSLTSWAVDVVESFGYVGVALMVALENLFPPIPSEVVLPMAGFLVGQDRFSFIPVTIAATIGSVVGAVILYGVGQLLGEHRLRALVRRYGKFFLLDEHDLDKTYAWFTRHGSTAVLLGRLVPGIRSLISIPAGLVRMSMARFILYTAIGSTIWNIILISAGWALGREWERVEQYTDLLQYMVIVTGILLASWYVWKRRHRIFA